MNMLPTTLDEVGSKRSKDLQVESGSYITLYTRETTNLSTNYFIIHLSFKALPKKFPINQRRTSIRKQLADAYKLEKVQKKKKTLNCWPAQQTQGDRAQSNRWYCSSTAYWSASRKQSHPNPSILKSENITKRQVSEFNSLHTSNTEILARLGPFFSKRSFFSYIIYIWKPMIHNS